MRKSAFVVLVGMLATAGSAFGWNSFGAIAVSPTTGAYGVAYGRVNLIDAQLTARRNCLGFDCQVAVSVRNSCASVAMGWNRRYAWAIRPTAQLAAYSALGNCNALNGGCQSLATICSYGF